MHTDTNSVCSVPCNLCGATDVEQISLRDRDLSYLRTVICRCCGLVYTDPRPDHEAVRSYYKTRYRMDYKKNLQPSLKQVYSTGKAALHRMNSILHLFQPSCRIIDIGGGGGEVVYALRKMGYDASGIEPNIGYAKFASDVLGVPMEHGFYQDIAIDTGSQDVITMFHVLEHFDSPCDALQHVRHWLRENGLLVVEVPNVEATCIWPSSRFHRAHLYNFNLATLETAGRKVGYEVLTSSVSIDGGNITAIFRKTNGQDSVSGEIPDNCDRILRIFRHHTKLRHLFSKHPYIRPFQRIAAGIDEIRATSDSGQATSILDGLISQYKVGGAD